MDISLQCSLAATKLEFDWYRHYRGLRQFAVCKTSGACCDASCQAHRALLLPCATASHLMCCIAHSTACITRPLLYRVAVSLHGSQYRCCAYLTVHAECSRILGMVFYALLQALTPVLLVACTTDGAGGAVVLCWRLPRSQVVKL